MITLCSRCHRKLHFFSNGDVEHSNLVKRGRERSAELRRIVGLPKPKQATVVRTRGRPKGDHDDPIQLRVILELYFAGLSPNEISTLNWEDIDNGVVITPKRTVITSPATSAFLETVRPIPGDEAYGKLLTWSRRCPTGRSPNTISVAVMRYKKELGFEGVRRPTRKEMQGVFVAGRRVQTMLMNAV